MEVVATSTATSRGLLKGDTMGHPQGKNPDHIEFYFTYLENEVLY